MRLKIMHTFHVKSCSTMLKYLLIWNRDINYNISTLESRYICVCFVCMHTYQTYHVNQAAGHYSYFRADSSFAPANARRCHFVTPSLIGCVQTCNQPSISFIYMMRIFIIITHRSVFPELNDMQHQHQLLKHFVLFHWYIIKRYLFAVCLATGVKIRIRQQKWKVIIFDVPRLCIT